MRIGLISDTHNNLKNTRQALKRFRAERITTILHAGDVTGPAVIQALKGFEVWIAWGNMDRDPTIQEIAATVLGDGKLDTLHHLILEGQRIALLHGDDAQRLDALIHSKDYDYVIHGHTHQRRDERVQQTHIINPGALGGTSLFPPSFAILDLQTGDVEFLEP